MAQHAEAKNVNQRIALETFVKINLAADGGNADAVAVMRDTRDDTGKEPPVACDVRSLRCGCSIRSLSVRFG